MQQNSRVLIFTFYKTLVLSDFIKHMIKPQDTLMY